MRIIAISDHHRKRLPLPGGDVLIHAGDLGGWGSELEVCDELRWIANQPHEHKIYVPGNHDWFVYENRMLAREFCESLGIKLLIDESHDIDGVRFYGSPWTPPFGDWAFMRDAERMKLYWEAVMLAETKPIDILITHGPPRGILDDCPGGPAGCPVLREAVRDLQPAFHLFGHIHEGHSRAMSVDWGGTYTEFLNVAVLDGKYQFTDGKVFCISLGQRGTEYEGWTWGRIEASN